MNKYTLTKQNKNKSKGECLGPSSWFLNTILYEKELELVAEVAEYRAESGNEQEGPTSSHCA